MNKRRLQIAALAVFVSHGAAVHAGDLVSMVQQTLDYDADVKEARAGFEAAKTAIPIARAALLPQISGGWGRAWNEIKMDGFPNQHYWQNGWTVQATQPIFDWSKWTAYRQADFVAAQGTVQLASAQQISMMRAVRAYFDELAAEDEFKRTNDYLAAIDAQREQVRRKRAAGEATLIDSQDVDVARAQAQIQQADAHQDLALKRRVVQQVSGQPFEALVSLPSGAPLPRVEPENPDVWADQAKSSGYDVQSKQLDWKIAQMDTKKARAAHYPVVQLTGTYTPAGAASGYSRPTTTTTAMLQVVIPISSGGEIQARVTQSAALEDKAQQAVESASVKAEGDARDSYSRYLKARVRSASLAQLVAVSHDTLAATEQGFKVGSRTQVDVLRAIDTLYTTQRDLMASRYEAIVALLQLKADAASLTMDDIARANALLSNAQQVRN
jgi:outer membrane protein